MFDGDLAENIINNTRRYINLLSDLIYELLPAYKVKDVSKLIQNLTIYYKGKYPLTFVYIHPSLCVNQQLMLSLWTDSLQC